jgi:hypothetical protein
MINRKAFFESCAAVAVLANAAADEARLFRQWNTTGPDHRTVDEYRERLEVCNRLLREARREWLVALNNLYETPGGGAPPPAPVVETTTDHAHRDAETMASRRAEGSRPLATTTDHAADVANTAARPPADEPPPPPQDTTT